MPQERLRGRKTAAPIKYRKSGREVLAFHASLLEVDSLLHVKFSFPSTFRNKRPWAKGRHFIKVPIMEPSPRVKTFSNT